MPTYVFSVNKVEVHNQKADQDHSDDDYLTIICTVANPITKDAQTLPAITTKIGSTIHTGDILNGPFRSNLITTDDSNIVIVNYLITNLGSTNVEDQFASAVKVTGKVAGVVATIAATISSTLIIGDPTTGLKLGAEIAKGINTVISTLSDIFDFLHIHVGPPNCNGEVLHDTLIFLPDQLKQTIGQSALREYPNAEQLAPPQPERCGLAPHTKVTFMVIDPFSLRQFLLSMGSDASKGVRHLFPSPTHVSSLRVFMGV